MPKIAIRVKDEPPQFLSQRHRTELQEQLGQSTDAFIRGADDAIELYNIALRAQRKAPTVKKQNAQLTTIARYASGLSKALNTLDSDSWHLLEAKRHHPDTAHAPIDAEDIRRLAVNANECKMPVRRGARGNFALTNLVHRIALVYQEATGLRATKHEHGTFHKALLVVLRSANAETEELAPLFKRAFPKK